MGDETERKGELPAAYLAAAQSKLSVEQRIALARKEGSRALESAATEADRIALKQVLHLVAQDAESQVRQALAEALAENTAAPHDIVLKLAQDDTEIAMPVLQLSSVLNEDDILAIIRSQTAGPRMSAIAARREVSPDICLALIDRGDEETTARLLRNPGAEISEPGMLRIVDQYGEHEGIQGGIIDRRSLPASVMEKVIALVSAELLTRMVERHAMPTSLAAKIMLDTRNRATLGLTAGMSSTAMAGLVAQLIAEGRLTHSILLRSVCIGNIEFVAHAIAHRAGVAVDDVRACLIHAVPSEIAVLWNRAKLPAGLLPIINAALGVLAESRADGDKWDAAYFRRRIIARVMTQCDTLDSEFDDDDLAFLLGPDEAPAKLADFGPAAANPA